MYQRRGIHTHFAPNAIATRDLDGKTGERNAEFLLLLDQQLEGLEIRKLTTLIPVIDRLRRRFAIARETEIDVLHWERIAEQ